MPNQHTAIYAYECDQCDHSFDVVMTFREGVPFDRDDRGQLHPSGYRETHPECPECHSHDVVRIQFRGGQENR